MMRRILCIMLSVVLVCATSVTLYASDLTTFSYQYGEQKYINNRDCIPSISADYIESIVGHCPKAQICSDEQVNASNKMLEKLSMLYLAVEQSENDLRRREDVVLSKAVSEMKKEIAELEKKILDDGAILLTDDQVKTMFADVNMGNSHTRNGVYQPPDTENTTYYLYGPYTINTNAGACTYYYVSAIAQKAASNMWSSYFIPMNEGRISGFIDSVVDIYVGKVAGDVVGNVLPVVNYFPWELLMEKPTTHYSTSATYTISTQCVTNVRFVWCYSPTMYEYFLGLVLNSTSVREVHDIQYVHQGVPYGEVDTTTYTLYCDNYEYVRNAVSQYWEGYENMHLAYIDPIKYFYNNAVVTTIRPAYAQGYYHMN